MSLVLLFKSIDNNIRTLPAAYIRLVQEVEIEFLQAVQKNMRMRAFLDRRKNARMFREGYSSTDRMAELYTEYFYAPVQGAIGDFSQGFADRTGGILFADRGDAL